jgi:hypothetical protein
MDVQDEEILNFWRVLQKYRVKYIMVGGFATNLHGFSRMTADLDIWIQGNALNKKAFFHALLELELVDEHFNDNEMQFVPGYTSFYFSSGFTLDVMEFMQGFEASEFDFCYEKASELTIEGITIRVLHLNHLIAAKEASNRPKDIIDVIELKKIRDSHD